MRVALDRLRSEACQGLPGCLLVVALRPLLTNFECHSLEDSPTAVREAFRDARDLTRPDRLPVDRADGVRFEPRENVEVMSTPDGRWPKDAGGTAIIGMPGFSNDGDVSVVIVRGSP